MSGTLGNAITKDTKIFTHASPITWGVRDLASAPQSP